MKEKQINGSNGSKKMSMSAETKAGLKFLKAGIVIGAIFMVIVFIVALLIARAIRPAEVVVARSTPVKKLERLHGIDISSYQKNYIEVIASRGATCDFVVMRATEGYEADSRCDPAYQYAKKRGLLLGVYFWGDPAELDPVDYADSCKSMVEGYLGEAIMILDFEPRNHESLNPEWARLWLEEFERVSGVKPLIYMNSYVATHLDWSSVIDGGYKIWVASYGEDDGRTTLRNMGAWTGNVVMFQYATCGLGGRETLDLDIFFGSRDDWALLASRNPSKNPG